MHYMWFDTETGGLNPQIHSLLTAYFAVCDKDLKIIDEIYLQLKPSDLSQLNVTEEAMNITKINLEEHLSDPNTITYEQGQKTLLAFFAKQKIKGKRRSLQPCGHNIAFDKDMIWHQLIPKEVWEKDVHYRTLDTSSICAFLKDVALIPQDVGSLTSLVQYFDIPLGEAHNARGDVLMNIEVYKAMRNLMKEKKEGFTGVTNSSLLQIVER